ncbi:uncharacterized protein LOC118436694 [Folsomia candida]|uniref:uncharacterized protein LOC118436694 n=1 Tax=Folsomia candida TaxID=158441 RepID=UPI001604BC7E|nr:uncharacterized protein LOC118436694 [Folsomia candida]
MQYTLGDKFMSRAAQGEFVFLNLKPVKWNWIPTSLVEISCEAGKYLVKPGEGNIVIRHGEVLNTTARTYLHFGDELGFMKYRDDISGGLAIFTFDEREYETNWDIYRTIGLNSSECRPENSDGLIFTPGQNHVIFSRILSYLSLGNLLNARLVCKQWGEQVTPLVRKKSTINFYSWTITPSLRFSQYVHEIKGVAPWPNWQIHCPYSVPGEGGDEKGRAAKYFADLNWFLDPRWGHHVRTLSLSGSIHSDQDYGVYIKIVTFFKDTLEELSVNLHIKIFNADGYEENYSTKDDLVFKNLKKLAIRINPDDARSLRGKEFSALWMKIWAGVVKGLDSMEIRGSPILGSRFVQELHKMGTLSHINLREIVLTCKAEDGLTFLADVNQPLKKVTLREPLEVRNIWLSFSQVLRWIAHQNLRSHSNFLY